MKIFGDRLRELRQAKGLSAVALGEALGISNASIIDWENNKHDVLAENVVKIAKFFNVPADYLLGLID